MASEVGRGRDHFGRDERFLRRMRVKSKLHPRGETIPGSHYPSERLEESHTAPSRQLVPWEETCPLMNRRGKPVPPIRIPEAGGQKKKVIPVIPAGEPSRYQEGGDTPDDALAIIRPIIETFSDSMKDKGKVETHSDKPLPAKP